LEFFRAMSQETCRNVLTSDFPGKRGKMFELIAKMRGVFVLACIFLHQGNDTVFLTILISR